MRTASGFSNAVTRAEALAASVPQVATTGPSSLSGDQYWSCDPDGIPQEPTTPTSAQWHNAITEELEAVLQLVGDTCDDTDNTQLAQALTIAAGALSHATDTGVATTPRTRVLVACTDSQAIAADSACIASDGGLTWVGENSATVAAKDAGITGSQSAALASQSVGVQGDHSAAVASLRVGLGEDGGFSLGAEADAGHTLQVDGANSGAVACAMTGDTLISKSTSLLVCSSGAPFVPFATPPSGGQASGQLYGGFGGACTARINFEAGNFHSATGVYATGNADYAERFPLVVPGEPLPARRLATHRGGKVSLARDAERILGVVSEHPAFLGDSPENGSHDDDGQWCPVALLGKVPVEVVGDVLPGDYLVPHADGRGVAVVEPPHTGRPVEVLEVREPFDAARGYGVALCLVG